MSLQTPSEFVTLDSRQKALWYAIRQALIIILGAIEDYLQIERSIVPRHKRRAQQLLDTGSTAQRTDEQRVIDVSAKHDAAERAATQPL